MALLEYIKSLPPVRSYRKRKYRRRFEREGSHNLFYGFYDSFAEAERDAPRNRGIGYDNPDAAAMYGDRLDDTAPNHYPLLFWLARCWSTVRTVLDYGGHRGTLYYSTRRLLGDGPEWWIYDVPAVVASGAEAAQARRASRLRFTARLDEAPPPDVLIAAGSLQYIEDDVEDWFRAVGHLPRHVLINATPCHADREFVTINNMGTAYCPYKVRHHQRFFDSFETLGYRTVDSWKATEKSCNVPFHVAGSEVTYVGGYFVRD